MLYYSLFDPFDHIPGMGTTWTVAGCASRSLAGVATKASAWEEGSGWAGAWACGEEEDSAVAVSTRGPTDRRTNVF